MRNPPEFLRPIWSSVSEITGWFDWDALGAIGTVAAVWFAVVQTTRAGRMERAKAVGILTFLIGLVEPIEIVSIYEDAGDDQLRDLPGDVLEQDLSIVRRAIAGLAALALGDVSSVGIVEWNMALPLALKDIEKTLERRSIYPESTVHSSLRYTQEAVVHFREQRERLQFGPLHRLMRIIWFRLTLRWR